MAEGLALGAAVLAGMLLLYFLWLKPAGYLAAAVGPITAKATAMGMGSPARFILGGVLLSSVHSLLEEYYWRWFLFGGLRRFMPVAAAVILSSLAFTAHHVILLAVYFGGWSLGNDLLFPLRGGWRGGLGLDLSPQRFAAGPLAQPPPDRRRDFYRGVRSGVAIMPDLPRSGFTCDERRHCFDLHGARSYILQHWRISLDLDLGNRATGFLDVGNC